MPNKKLKILTLCLVHKNGRLLLGLKKRGFGAGRWNGFGGKVEAGETIEEAAARELFEESSLRAESMEEVGKLDFRFNDDSDDLEMHIFKCSDFFGEPEESEEMKPQWFDEKEVPLHKMWADDEHWLPLLISNKRFEGWFLFDSERGNNIIEKEIKIK